MYITIYQQVPRHTVALDIIIEVILLSYHSLLFIKVN